MIGLKSTFKLDLSNIAKLIEEVKKPMSLNEIMTKFNVSYPFKALCVKEFYDNETKKSCKIKGNIYTFYKDDNKNYARSFELDFYKKDKFLIINKNSKKFKYIPELGE